MPIGVVSSAHEGVLEGADKVRREGEEGGQGLEGGSMRRREARRVVAMLRAAKDGLMEDWLSVPVIPYGLHGGPRGNAGGVGMLEAL